MNDLQRKIYSYALGYIDKGWCVLPCFNYLKSPAVNWKEYQAKLATAEDWSGWSKDPRLTGICLITGKISNVAVVDVDSKGDDGVAKHMEREFNLYGCPVVSKTRSGGYHFFYKWSENTKTIAHIAKGFPVDCRAEGGIVLVPPSLAGENRGEYSWIKLPSDENISKMTVVPSEVSNHLGAATPKSSTVNLAKMVGLPEGSRDDQMTKAALSLVSRMKPEEWEPLAWPTLQQLNNTLVPPLQERCLRGKFDSAVRKKSAGLPMAPDKGTEIKKFSEMTDDEIREKEIRETVSLGFGKLDRDFGFPTGFYLILGNSGAGKSWFSLFIARQLFERHQKKTAYFSIEMTLNEIKTRLLQAWSDIPYRDFKAGQGDTTKAISLMKKDAITFHRFANDGVEYETPDNFEKDFLKFKSQGYKVFIFDHLHELEGAIEMEKNQKIMSEWGKLFQKLSGEHLDCWFFIFAQPGAGASNKRILDRNDIWGSKTINYKVQFIMTLNNMVEKDENGLPIQRDGAEKPIMIFLDKNRYTPAQYIVENTALLDTGNFRLTEFVPTTQFEREIQETFEI